MMNDNFWPSLVKREQFAVPAYFEGKVSNWKVMLSYDCMRKDIHVLHFWVEGHQFFYALSNKPFQHTKLGWLILGYELVQVNDEILMNESNRIFIMKVFDKPMVIRSQQEGKSENPMHEIAAMQLLRGAPHLPKDTFSVIAEDRLYCIMPYENPMEGLRVKDMLAFIDENQRDEPFRNEVELRYVFRCIMTGVEIMHENGLSHRDLSLENILVVFDENTNIRDVQIIDFGLVWRQLDSYSPNPRPSYGKRYYTPPEVFTAPNDDRIDPRVLDIWACGIILFILATGSPLFDAAIPSDDIFYIHMSDPRNGLKSYLLRNGMSFDLVEVICDMLRLDPFLRPTAKAVLQYNWFS